MADVVAEQIVKPVHERELNGDAEVREVPDPVDEAAKKKKKKKKKGKSATTGEDFLWLLLCYQANEANISLFIAASN